MTLSVSSALHYWSARYGSVPIIGGKPVHSRSSAASWIDQNGILQSAIINTPRMRWADLGDGAGRRQVMQLEAASTNPILWSSDFSNAAWTKTTMTVTTGIADPFGGSNACTLTATGANASVLQAPAVGSSIVRTSSLWVRRRTGIGIINLLKPDNSTFTAIAVTAAWQRFQVQSSAAGTAKRAQLQIVTSGDAIDVLQSQVDDGLVATSEIPTTSVAVTRAADSFYWDYTADASQAVMMYARWIDDGGVLGDLLEFGSASFTNPELIIANTGGGRYEAYQNGVTSTPAASPTAGDVVEFCLSMAASGSVTGIISVNGAAAVAGAPSGTSTPPTAWSDTKLWLNSIGTISPGLRRFAEVKVVKFGDVVASTPQGIRDELAAFELGPNGVQL